MYRINGHGHLLPEPDQIPSFMKEERIFWIDADKKFMRQADWKRPVTDPSFFLEEKLQWMAANQIDHEVLLNLSQLYCNGMEPSLAEKVLRFQNEFNAGVQASYPDKFTCGFVLQPASLKHALKEMRFCVEQLGLKLWCLPTHFQEASGEWKATADLNLAPLFELANDYGLALEIHPYDGNRMVQLMDNFWRFHLVWMCAQTADHYHFFTLLDFPERYPSLRTCYAHGNQFGQVNIGRRIQGFKGRPDLFEGAVDPRKNTGAKNVFFDTLVHDIYSLRLLIERQGVQQVVMGLDDPYPLGEMETVPGCYPGQVVDEALAAGIIDQEAYEGIWYSHILNWLEQPGDSWVRSRLAR